MDYRASKSIPAVLRELRAERKLFFAVVLCNLLVLLRETNFLSDFYKLFLMHKFWQKFLCGCVYVLRTVRSKEDSTIKK